MKITAKNIAHVIADKCLSLGIEDISQMKLQKLIFFTWAFYGVLYNERLFDEEPYAWNLGPLFKLFRAEIMYLPDGGKRGSIALTKNELKYGSEDLSSKRINDHIDNIIADYGKMSANELVKKSHMIIWQEAHHTDSQLMDWNKVTSYYRKNLKEIVLEKLDEEVGVITIISNIIPGLALEYEKYTEFIEEIQDIGTDLIKENCSAAN